MMEVLVGNDYFLFWVPNCDIGTRYDGDRAVARICLVAKVLP